MCGDKRQLTQIARPACVTFLDERLESKEEVKNLGVVMDKNLTWESHVKRISDRCFGILIGLANAKHVLPREVLPKLIDSLVMSHVRYCAQVYGSAGSTVIGKIQKVMNFAARTLSNRQKYDHISDVLAALDWLNSKQLIEYSDLRMLHKVISTGRPDVLSSRYRFNHEIVSRETRQSGHLALVKPRTNHGKRSFVYRSSQLYNSVCVLGDVDLKAITVRSFKRYAREVVRS